MRPRFLALALLLGIAAPATAQTCLKAPLPNLPELFPDQVEGLDRQFYNRMDACYTNMYRPSPEAVQGGALWAVVSIEPSADPFLGEVAQSLANHYERLDCETITVDGWPVAVNANPAGPEFVTLRGGARISVVVKNGDGGAPTKDLATAFFRAIFPKVPCG